MRDLRFKVFVRRSQGCGNGSRGGVDLVFASWVWPTGREYRRWREALPLMPPQRDYLLKIRLSTADTFRWVECKHISSPLLTVLRLQ